MNDMMVNPAFSWHPVNIFYEESETNTSNTSKIQKESSNTAVNHNEVPIENLFIVIMIVAIIAFSIMKAFEE